MFELGPAMQGEITWQAESTGLPLALQRERAKHDPPSPCCTAPISASLMVLICHHGKENPATCKRNICSAGCLCLALASMKHDTVCWTPPPPLALGALQQHWLQCDKGQGCVCLPPTSGLTTAASEPKAKPLGGFLGMWAGTGKLSPVGSAGRPLLPVYRG